MISLEEQYEWFDKRITIHDPETFLTYMKMKGFERIKKAYFVLHPHLEIITDEDMRDVYKYDLRLRRDIYYYLTMFEVYLRAQLSNRYTKDRFDLNRYDMASDESLFEILEHATFGKLIHLYDDLSENEINTLNGVTLPKKEFIDRLTAVKNLRNAVFHHNFLLDFDDYANCDMDGFNVCSLISNLLNLYLMLPSILKEKFVTRINRTDRKLRVPKEVVVRLEIER